MEFAEQFHQLPWEIFRGRKILWWSRWKALRDIRQQVAEQKELSADG